MLFKFLAIMILLTPAYLSASEREVINAYEVTNVDANVLRQIADLFEITDRTGNTFTVYVPMPQIEAFTRITRKYKLIKHDINKELQQSLITDNNEFTGYRSYSNIQEELAQMQRDHPDTVRIITYGKSRNGRDLQAIKLSDNVMESEGDTENKILITAAMHGDEIITTEVILNLLNELLIGFQTFNPRLQAMITDNEIYIIPVTSPDSFIRRSRYTHGYVDPNRQFPWPEKPNRNPIACINNLMEFAKSLKIDGYLDIHAYGKMIMYPWAFTLQPIKDPAMENMFDELTTFMAEENNYRHGSIAKTIYVAKGSSVDYFHWILDSKAIAVELGRKKAPRARDISKIVNQSREMLWRFIESF